MTETQEPTAREPERWAMRVVGAAGYGYDGPLEVGDVAYVAEYDLEYGGGRGMARLTENPEEAQTWPTAIEVFEAWRASPASRPRRADGRPNRPLTAYTITPERIQ